MSASEVFQSSRINFLIIIIIIIIIIITSV